MRSSQKDLCQGSFKNITASQGNSLRVVMIHYLKQVYEEILRFMGSIATFTAFVPSPLRSSCREHHHYAAGYNADSSPACLSGSLVSDGNVHHVFGGLSSSNFVGQIDREKLHDMVMVKTKYDSICAMFSSRGLECQTSPLSLSLRSSSRIQVRNRAKPQAEKKANSNNKARASASSSERRHAKIESSSSKRNKGMIQTLHKLAFNFLKV